MPRGPRWRSRRLEVALDALGRRADDGHAQSAASPRGASAQQASVRQRAPRGQNLRRIREVIDERPGATAGEISAATGIARPTVAATLGKLVGSGELVRSELPAGRVGFRRAHEATAAGTVGEDSASDETGAKAADSG